MDFRILKQKNGFGLIGLLITMAIIAILAVGGLYIGSSGERKSTIEINRDALQRAEDLQKMVEERNRQAEELLKNNDQGSPSEQTCGGPLDIKCPSGYECKLIDPLPGASGRCVPSKN